MGKRKSIPFTSQRKFSEKAFNDFAKEVYGVKRRKITRLLPKRKIVYKLTLKRVDS